MSFKWDELIVRDVISSSTEHSALKEFAELNRYGYFERNHDTSYAVSTLNGGYEDYKTKLSGNSRRKTFGQRKKLNALGTITRSNLWPDNSEDFYAFLNAYHVDRFGEEVYSVTTQSMFNHFCFQLESEGGKIVMEQLALDGKIISVAFDIEWKNRIYNLQSGFDMNFQSISLGLLHLGYRIESAFNSNSCKVFDLMCGIGKTGDYKRKISNFTSKTNTIVISKNRLLTSDYRLIEMIRRIKQKL
jgi:CelD/BcsL family acetyltransferase involved in cellulose biosynthesis